MIANYTDLQSAVATWLNRDDLTDVIPDFIRLAESQISRRLRRNTVRTEVQIVSDSYAIPSTVAQLRSLRLVTSSYEKDLPIVIVTPEQLAEHRAANSSTGRPRYAAVVAGNLLFVPAPDDSYTMEMSYFSKLVPLSSSVPTNDVLTESPDLYLFGALKESAAYLEHDERIPVWESKFETALQQLEIVREREEYTASLRPARLPRVF